MHKSKSKGQYYNQQDDTRKTRRRRGRRCVACLYFSKPQRYALATSAAPLGSYVCKHGQLLDDIMQAHLSNQIYFVKLILSFTYSCYEIEVKYLFHVTQHEGKSVESISEWRLLFFLHYSIILSPPPLRYSTLPLPGWQVHDVISLFSHKMAASRYEPVCGQVPAHLCFLLGFSSFLFSFL